MRRLMFFTMVLTILCMTSFSAFSGSIPQIINYQGTLTDKTGAPVANGSYNIEFNIYDVATGGISLWNEKWSSTATPASPVIVSGGGFNVMLGALNPLPVNFFALHPDAYLGIKVGIDSEMLPRQQFSSVGYAFAAGNGVPRGGIIMWSGAITSIPEGWALCDGNNGTPNLRDRFIVGAGGGYAVSGTGGSSTVNASHNHPINAESPATNATGDHSHHIDVQFYNGIGDTTDGAADGSKNVGSESHGHHLVADTWGANIGNHAHTVNAHAHGGATLAGGSTTLGIIPPYYALAFIMKL